MASTDATPSDEEILDWAMAQTRAAPDIPRMATHRAVTCWLLDRGLSHDDIDAIPAGVKQDYLRLWELGLVGPLAERRAAYLQLLAARAGGKDRRPTIGDIFPELRAVFEDV